MFDEKNERTFNSFAGGSQFLSEDKSLKETFNEEPLGYDLTSLGISPVHQAEIVPVASIDSYSEKLTKHFKASGYVLPNSNCKSYENQTKTKSNVSFGLFLGSMLIAMGSLAFTSSFKLVSSLTDLVPFVPLLAPILISCLFYINYEYQLKKLEVAEKHWEPAVILWGLLNIGKVELPEGLKNFTEEQLRYAISAAEVVDWAYKHNIPTNDPRWVVAEGELTRSKEVIELITCFTTGAEKNRPPKTYLEDGKVFANEVLTTNVAVEKWEKFLHQNFNITVKQSNTTQKLPTFSTLVNSLEEIENTLNTYSSAVPHEVMSLMHKYLPESKKALATLEWAEKYSISDNDEQVADAKKVSFQTQEVYRTVQRVGKVLETFNKTIEAEKEHPPHVVTNDNANSVKKANLERKKPSLNGKKFIRNKNWNKWSN